MTFRSVVHERALPPAVRRPRPLHLLALLGAASPLAAYAASRLLGDPPALRIAVWFVGAAVVWDLRARAAAARWPTAALRRAARGACAVSPVNYVRVPLAAVGAAAAGLRAG